MTIAIDPSLMSSPQQSTALFQLLRFTSPSLPVGGFAWSQGLEMAIDGGWLRDAEELHAWLEAMMLQNMARQELPLLSRLLSAQESADILLWNRNSLALRETAELRLEDVQSGRAVLQLARSLALPFVAWWPEEDISYVTAFALVCQAYQIAYADAATGLVWSWLDNQITAAMKLLPLGQTAGQLLIEQLAPLVAGVVTRALAVDDVDIGISLPGQVMASMLHETQYSRLFRS